MPAPENRFKSRLAAGEVLVGAWVAFADAYAAEITASAGFDWLLIDGEHGPNDLRSIMAQLRVIEASGTPPWCGCRWARTGRSSRRSTSGCSRC